MAYTTVDDPSQYFHTQLYTGNGSSSRALTNDANAGDFQPDWLWVKNRSNVVAHGIWDSTRGAGKRLIISTDDEEDQTNVASFDSDGFTVNTGDIINTNTHTYVAWQWKANAGSRTTFTESGSNPGGGRQVNTTAGFSLIDYTGTGSNGTIAHGLGAVPNVVLVKNRDGGTNDSWFWHWTGLLGDNKVLYWNSTDSSQTNASAFNSTAPTSTNITVGTNSATNADGNKYIMYAFTNIKGYSKVGIYTGNGDSSGAFAYTGFKPAWIMIKRSDSSTNGDWAIYDNKRSATGGGNENNKFLRANGTNAEASASGLDILSNGFKIRSTSSRVNANDSTYVYLAFAVHPYVSSKGVPTTAR
tara:strand:- start:43 stop:1113 length:1071 start_codon:yes stop_codon:yes gene_type:complete